MKTSLTPLLFTTIINRFGGSCGSFEKEKKPIVINNIGSICPKKKLKKKKKKKNNHGEVIKIKKKK